MEIRLRKSVSIGLIVLALLPAGCLHDHHHEVPGPDLPRELAKVSLPEYVIEPPDILKIDALQVIPLPPYKVQSLDILAIRVSKTLPDEPIAGIFSVEPDGTVNLGLSYGRVSLVGLTLEQAKKSLEKQLQRVLKEPQVDITVAQGRGVQQIRGDHLVRIDGTVALGSYGSVKVAGKTLTEAKADIEAHLALFLQRPEVTVDVLGYNSKVYYVIFDQGGVGQRIIRLPITGNETVLDAFALVSGMSVVSDQNKIWLSRPSRAEEPEQMLPIDWRAITLEGRSTTNYQLHPGDRLYVQAYQLVKADNTLARIFAPMTRIFGFALIGSSITGVQNFQFRGNNGTTTTTTTH